MAHGRQPRPAWFGRAPYRTVRIREDYVQEWLAQLVAAPEDGWLARLWAAFARERAAARHDLDAFNWRDSGSWDLVSTIEAGLAVERAIEEFLPEPWAARFPPEVMWALFMHALLIPAFNRALEDPSERFDPHEEIAATLPAEHRHDLPLEKRVLLPALRAETFRLAAPEAKRELLRRGGARRGFPGAVILYLMRAEPAAPRILTEVDAERATEDLVTQVMKLLARRGGRWVWPALRAETRGERRAEATSQAPLTLAAWAKSAKVADELEILARAVEGELDVIPLAVARDLQDRAKPEVHWTESLIGEEEIRITIEEETPPDPAAALDSRLDTRREIERFLAACPRHRAGLELALTDTSLAAEAAKRGVSVSALSQRRTAAIQAFSHWLRADRGLSRP